MRALASIFLWIATGPGVAQAVEVSTDVSASREFLFMTNDVKQGLFDDRLSIGAGHGLVSDWRVARQSARGSIEVSLEPILIGLHAAYAPPQAGRGFASVAARVQHEQSAPRVRCESALGLLLRRADAGSPPGYTPPVAAIGQLQIEAELRLSIDDRVRLAAGGLLSFYAPDLARPGLLGADLGLLITLAGRPERWSLFASGGVQVSTSWRLEAGLAGVAYADRRGGAAAPRISARVGPFRGLTVEASVELAIGAFTAATDPPRGSGGLAFEYER